MTEPQLTRQQEKQLDKELQRRGINKQEFLAKRIAQTEAQIIEESYSMHPAVAKPRDPVTGRPAVKSQGKYGPHFSGKYPTGLARVIFRFRRRMWIEHVYTAILLPHTKHSMLGPMFTMWASMETKA